jgi:hypothetical protein
MGQGSARIFNILSIVFIVLTILFVLFVIAQLVAPPPVRVAQVLPTVASIPTDVPTNTPRPTLPPTFTLTPTETLTPTATQTETPTLAPSPTITETPGPTPTPTITPTPTVTETATLIPTSDAPTITSPPPYVFGLDGEQVIYTTNFINSAGCSWQGVTGNVFDQNNAPLPGIVVHVFNAPGSPQVDQRVRSGSNSLVGEGSGWEVGVGNTPSPSTFFVQLETEVGTIVSDRVQVVFPGTCDQNQAIVNFIQVRPIGS